MFDVMIGNWWAIALRGGAALLFGVLALLTPGLTLDGLVTLFATYALADGVLALWVAWRAGAAGGDQRVLLVGGLASVVVGLLALLWPDLSAFGLLLLVGVRALAAGATDTLGALRLRREGHPDRLPALAGGVTAGLGLLFLVLPATGGSAVLWWIVLYAAAVGGLFLLLGLRLRALSHGSGDGHIVAAA